MNGGDREWADTRAALGHVMWLLGGSRAGKSTVRKMLVEEFGFASYDGDAGVFKHMEFCTKEESPALWTGQRLLEKNQFWEWLLAMNSKDMADGWHDAGREDFEYVVSDLLAMPADTKIVADIFAPHIDGIVRVAKPQNLVVMLASDTFQREMIIETGRVEGEQLENYIEGQRLFSKCVRSEAERLNLSVLETGGRLNIDEMYAAVCRHFELSKTSLRK